MRLPITITLAALVALAALPAPTGRAPAPARPGAARKEAPMTMHITSTAFAAMTAIPRRHTCEGEDLSPPLAWSGVPAGAKSLALVVDDPDAPDPAAPRMDWVHWVLYDLPPATTGLAAGVARDHLPQGTLEGRNDWRQPGWRGPCPPIGRHRYFHRLYALDVVLPDLDHPTRAALMKAMAGHVIATAELIGTYQKTR
jgi:Raf kinase inhibitor-like YbhB/YbcL family protein